MPREAITLAQRFRRARESFLLARQLGCSPAQALERKRSEEADRHWRESGERLRAVMACSHPRAPAQAKPAAVVTPDPTTPAAPRLWWLD
ncbi:MAG: hypothetical protein C0409_15335 [Novosphingobium sp.]|nr:hypothetical protein [Novosphingobium sp.]